MNFKRPYSARQAETSPDSPLSSFFFISSVCKVNFRLKPCEAHSTTLNPPSSCWFTLYQHASVWLPALCSAADSVGDATCRLELFFSEQGVVDALHTASLETETRQPGTISCLKVKLQQGYTQYMSSVHNILTSLYFNLIFSGHVLNQEQSNEVDCKWAKKY